MGADALQAEYEFYDIQSRRKRGGGMYLCDARLLLGDGTSVVLEDGWAGRVPATQALALLAIRDDLYAVPSRDQSPLKIVEVEGATPVLTEADFEPLPDGAISGKSATPAVAIAGGHRVPPGRPQVSPEELERRKASAAAYIDQLAPSERPGATAPAAAPPQPDSTVLASDGQPIVIPAGVTPGTTPGWPTNEFGEPLRLTDAQRRQAAEQLVAKTGDELPDAIAGTAAAPAAAAPAPAPVQDPDDVVVSDVDLVAPLPDGFSARTESDEPRCLAAKSDGSQCQNAARPPQHPQACHMVPHQEKVEQAAREAQQVLA